MATRTFKMGHATCTEDGASRGLIESLKEITRKNEENSIQKASERTDGLSYYNCNAIPKIEDLADELAKLDENIVNNALRVLDRKIKEKKAERKNKK